MTFWRTVPRELYFLPFSNNIYEEYLGKCFDWRQKNGQVGKKYLTSLQRLERPPFPQVLFPPTHYSFSLTPWERNEASACRVQSNCRRTQPMQYTSSSRGTPAQHRQPGNKLTLARQLLELSQLHLQLRNKGDPGHRTHQKFRGITLLPTTGLGKDLSRVIPVTCQKWLPHYQETEGKAKWPKNSPSTQAREKLRCPHYRPTSP